MTAIASKIPDRRGAVDRRVAAAAVAAMLAAGAASMAIAGGIGGVLAAGLGVVAVLIAVIDARHYIIPDTLNAAGLVLGLAFAGVTDFAPGEAAALALVRGGVLAGLFLALRCGYRRWRGREGLGLGDVKLAVVAGVWLDWSMIPIAVEIAALSALAGYGVLSLVRRRRYRARARLPFGLFFAPAIWIAWAVGQGLAAS